jgi:pilus assembly protein Flp/PilA
MNVKLRLRGLLLQLIEDERGLSMVEYAVAGGFVAAVVAASTTTLGTAVTTQIRAVVSALG